MKVFFQASHIQRGKYESFYQRIYNELKKVGYSILSDEIISISTKKYYSQVEDQDKTVLQKLYDDNIKKIEGADINVFEVSVPSIGIGYLIEHSLQAGKPTVVLYIEGNPVYFLLGADDDKLVVSSYTSKTLESTVSNSLIAAREVRDKRFNFFISQKILEYLDRASSQKGVTKSQFIRELILEHKKNSSQKTSE